MEICICAATSKEIEPLLKHLREKYIEHHPYRFTLAAKHVDILITGFGMLQTTYSVTRYLEMKSPAMMIQAGIGGTFHRDRELGTVVQVVQETIAELGYRDSEDRFTSMFETDLMDKNQPPFKEGILKFQTEEVVDFLPAAKGISCNSVTGTEKRRQELLDLFNPDVESMEGAGFFYPCLMHAVPFLEIRAISNYVGDRKRKEWKVPLAIENLNQVLMKMLEVF